MGAPGGTILDPGRLDPAMASSGASGRTLGVVITYRPDAATVPGVLRSAYAATDGLVVVDNRSTPESRGLIERAVGPGAVAELGGPPAP